jgi:hypothetical protein
MKQTFAIGISFAVVLVGTGCDSAGGGGGGASSPTNQYDSSFAKAWFDTAYDVVKTEGLPPPIASRLYGYAGVALYESVLGGMPNHRTLAGQLNGLASLPATAGNQYHWPAVANAALPALLKSLLPTASAPSISMIDTLEQQFATQFQTEVGVDTYDRSVALGQTLATSIASWAAADGITQNTSGCVYNVPPPGNGAWEPTPPAFAPNPALPCWGQQRPFVLAAGNECPAIVPPAYDEDPGSAFYAEVLVVYNTGNNLTQEEQDIATFWADGPVTTGTPPGHWVSIVGQVCEQTGAMLDVAAEAYARVGIAVADAFIQCWYTKYEVNLCRPVTYIQNVVSLDDPAAATWPPFIATPAFPEYTSGHSTQSGAASLVLTDLFGSVPFVDDTHADLGFPARSFDSFFDAAKEAAISRLYGGIHYSFACELGVDQGQCVGQTILDHVTFQDS